MLWESTNSRRNAFLSVISKSSDTAITTIVSFMTPTLMVYNPMNPTGVFDPPLTEAHPFQGDPI